MTNLTDGTHYTPKYTEEGVKFISVTNITENQIDFYNTKYISEEEHILLTKRCCPREGDILLTKIGSIGRAAIIPSNAPAFSIFVSVALLQLKKGIDNHYLCAYLNTKYANKQFLRHLKGIGVPDLHLENIAQTQVIFPDYKTQKLLSSKLDRSQHNRTSKNQRADTLLNKHSERIMNLFDLRRESNYKYCFAIKYCNLDGVIDAKRYMNSNNNGFHFVISDVCDVLENKSNVSSHGNTIIDWIRIDDLPNQPMDIETIRTQPASELEGSFFEVQPNDILVARLGPTILNQKIVLVRHTERTTIASAEFLVLRCKKGYDPEAVMAVLKTPYYRDLMYSHARGSTPSRYRLNREDMLSLPFPDIKDKQATIANDAISIRNEVVSLRKEAEQEWQEAKRQFEKELLGE